MHGSRCVWALERHNSVTHWTRLPRSCKLHLHEIFLLSTTAAMRKNGASKMSFSFLFWDPSFLSVRNVHVLVSWTCSTSGKSPASVCLKSFTATLWQNYETTHAVLPCRITVERLFFLFIFFVVVVFFFGLVLISISGFERCGCVFVVCGRVCVCVFISTKLAAWKTAFSTSPPHGNPKTLSWECLNGLWLDL